MRTLPFKVVPQFLEDLGLNLYTSLDKVLVEFIANAHDADASSVQVIIDVPGIDAARKALRATWVAECENAKALQQAEPEPLESRTLPENWKIIIQDDGHGMSEEDLRNKFLQVSRRKRDDEGTTSPGKRVFMGRKGLGKLAGFGVAQKIVVTSLKQGEPDATQITLDYLEIRKCSSMNEVEVPCETIPGNAGFEKGHGTRIELTRLVFSGLRGTQETAIRHAVECFWMVDAGDFAILQNDHMVLPKERSYEWVYPEETGRPDTDLVHRSIELAGHYYDVRYRIRFTPSKGQLKSGENGVRLYAHKRLACAPSLFEVPSSSTGYTYTSYLDGVIVADFVDEQPTDYIGTNRQGLRWETPLLADLYKFLQDEIREALKAYYATKENTIADKVNADAFTKLTIGGAELPEHRRAIAYRIAVVLAKGDPDEVQSTFYKKSLPIVVGGLSRGDVLRAISELAGQDHPDLGSVIKEITELTKQEFGDFLAFVQGRLDGIGALKKIVDDQDFKKANNEDELQTLFEENPWLIDPTFFQFMSANETQGSLNGKLAEHLGVAAFATKDLGDPQETKKFGLNKRPDLTFVLGNSSLHKIVIVELKAPNTPLHADHLSQLKRYIRRTEDYLATAYNAKEASRFQVRGILIGCRASGEDSKAEKVLELKYDEDKRPDSAEWEVMTVMQVLDRTELAHREIIDLHERAKKAPLPAAKK